MKRLPNLILLILFVCIPMFADEAKLIDFTTLESVDTEVDFSSAVGFTLPGEGAESTIVSLSIDQWEVELNSSASTVENLSLSYTLPAPVTGGEYQGDTVLGVRVHFPLEPFDAWALVTPPFEIPGYYGVDGAQFDNYGVVRNVGTIKEIHVNAYGLNFPHTLSIILEDHKNQEKEYMLGSLEFEGWRQLTWQNPVYIEDVRQRELRKYPLYPELVSMIKLVGFKIYRDALDVGGDFVAYIKDVDVIYDRAVIDLETDIVNEEIWGIIGVRAEELRTAQFQRLGELQVLRYIEEQRKHQDDQTTQ